MIGFDLVRDENYDTERWIEVEPPDRSVVLVLSRRPPDEPRRRVPDLLPHSQVFFDCEDIEQTHAELSERALGFPAARAVRRQLEPVPSPTIAPTATQRRSRQSGILRGPWAAGRSRMCGSNAPPRTRARTVATGAQRFVLTTTRSTLGARRGLV